MDFSSTAEFQAYVVSRIMIGVQRAQEQFYHIIDQFVREYYAGYDPIVYERTYQLYRSLVRSDVRSTGMGAEAEVYFDASQLNYSIKTFFRNGGMNPFTGAVSPSGVFVNNGWDAQATLESAAHGLHGGLAVGDGTSIWDDPLDVLHAEGYEILKQRLREAGLPLK